MNIDELKRIFSECYQDNVLFAPHPRARTPKQQVESNHSMYPIRQYAALSRALNDLSESQEKLSVRYLVSEQNKLLLAREGKPDSSVPMHREIRNCCRAAGNLHFSPDYQAFTKITHESGDFQLDAASLIWPIATLVHMNTPLTNPFTIEICDVDDAGGFHITSQLELNHQQLVELLPSGIAEAFQAANTDETIEDNDCHRQASIAVSNPHGLFAYTNTPPKILPSKKRARTEAAPSSTSLVLS